MAQKTLSRVLLVLGMIFLGSALFASNNSETDAMIKLYLDSFKKSFGELNQAQAQSIAQIISSFLIYGDRDFRKLSYILATAWHESKLALVKEKRGAPGSDLYQRQEAYWPSGYYGRGFVQLTHKTNYEKLGKFLNIDLVKNPDLALDRRYAADIINIGMMEGLFTGLNLARFINTGADYINARKVVNGLDRAELIAGYTDKINKNLEYQIV